jgi:lactoylglutathione lyase
MKIEHIACWVTDLEKQKAFYEKYFGAKAGARYVNAKKNFQSYFLSFDTGARLELMHRPDVPTNANDLHRQYIGLIHFAMAVGSKEGVDRLTEQLHSDGFAVLDGPRTTGDGYYESVVLDPEGNRIEITI